MAPPMIRVAVIGGGPGAMFFCHALNKQKKASMADEEASDNNKRTDLLEVTCFEMASTPGGIWRSPGPNSSVYSELWTNGASHCLEFYDYTFDEHFEGEPVPVYLPRRDINEYLMQRVTRNDPTFFEDYFEFDTEVVNVSEVTHDYDNNNNKKGQLLVTVRKTKTGEISTRLFDKCIWAAGENAEGFIPAELRKLFSVVGRGKKIEDEMKAEECVGGVKLEACCSDQLVLLHSTETMRMRENVRDKRVLLIGGGLSAEDLALQCLKWGATRIDVASRSEDPDISYISKWPGDRVQLHLGMAVKSVEEDGAIVLEQVEFVWPSNYEPAEDITTTTLRDINVVIFCTGYKPNISMLDATLQPPSGSLPAFFMGTHASMSLELDPNFSWDKWSMATDHPAHEYTGAVPAAQGKMLRVNYNHPDMHRGVLFRNPNMMFLLEHGSDTPLLALDIYAWLLCSYLTGLISMPSIEELQEANRQQVLDQMHLPFLRYYFDEEYFRVLDDAGDDYWVEDGPGDKAWGQEEEYMLRLLVRVMDEGKYPGVSLGTYEKLNKKGKAMLDFGASTDSMRYDVAEYKEDTEWRTFRDDVEMPEFIYSLYTKSEARPLKKRWMDAVGPSCSIKNGDI